MHGTSAGAGSVGIHLTAYGGRDDHLFVGAIAQSPFFPTQPTVPELEWQFDRFATAANCSNATYRMDCLRSRDVSVLAAANVGSPYPGQSVPPDFYFTPTIDGDLIRDYPLRLFKQGQHIKVPFMVGDETDEGSYFVSNASTPANVSSFFTANYPHLTPSETAEINNLYPLMSPLPQHAAYFPSVSAAYGESTFVCPGLDMSASLSQDQEQQVWNYQFNVTSIQNTAAGVGVPHTFDTAAIFGPNYNGPPTTASVQSFETYNAAVVPILMDYYISFVRTLSPNILKNSAAPIWQPFLSGGCEKRLLLNANSTAMIDVPLSQQQRCQFWSNLVAVTEQ